MLKLDFSAKNNNHHSCKKNCLVKLECFLQFPINQKKLVREILFFPISKPSKKNLKFFPKDKDIN